jgi:hypothetical protein
MKQKVKRDSENGSKSKEEPFSREIELKLQKSRELKEVLKKVANALQSKADTSK